MAHNFSPTYFSTFHDTVSTLCKSILQPFSLSNRRLPDRKLAKRHSEHLKWQQNSFHRILHLNGLHKEGLASSQEVASFRSHLLDTLIAAPADQEPVDITRDKLHFLKELLSAKCISAEEYHSSKRPLLQRMAAQGEEINDRDVIVGGVTEAQPPEEEWSEIDLRDKENSVEKKPTRHRGIKSLLGKRKPFRALFHNGQQESETVKKQWGLDGFKKRKKGNCEEENAENVRSSFTYTLRASPIGEGPDTKRLKNKMHSDGSASDFFIDKVLGENIKKELVRIQSELSVTNPNLTLSDDQMEAISTKLPVDKADLKHFFPNSWCDRYGDVVLDVVRKEFKDHVGEMEALRVAAKEKQASLG